MAEKEAAGCRDRPKKSQDINRRSFLNYLLGTGVFALLSAILYPIIRFIMPPKVPEASTNRVVAAKIGELAPNSGKIFRFGSEPGILISTPEGELRAFSAICTHLACTVQYRADLQHIWCACHNGHYDLHGKNIAGPPPRPLEHYNAQVSGENVIVTKG